MLKTAALNYFGIPYTQGSWWDKFAARMEPLKTIYMATSMRDPSTGRDLETEEMKNHPADKRISKNQKTGAVYTGKDSILISNIAFKIADFLGYKEELLSGSQAGFLMSPNGIEKVFMPWAPYRAEFARPLGLKGITLDRSKAANTPGLNALYADPFYDNTAKAKNLNLKDERGYSPGQRVKETDDKLFPLFKKRFEKDIPETKFQVHLAAIYLEQEDKDKSVKDYETLARKYITRMTADYNPILKKLDELPPNYITNWDSRNKVLAEYNKEAGFTTAEQVREAYTKQRENKKITKEEYYYAMSHAEQIAGDNKYPMKVDRR